LFLATLAGFSGFTTGITASLGIYLIGSEGTIFARSAWLDINLLGRIDSLIVFNYLGSFILLLDTANLGSNISPLLAILGLLAILAINSVS
jgi:hypothetical protein